jgi:hypothetical protein
MGSSSEYKMISSRTQLIPKVSLSVTRGQGEGMLPLWGAGRSSLDFRHNR